MSEDQSKDFEHEHFGMLTFDGSLGLYEATVSWFGRQIQLYLSATTDDRLGTTLQIASQLWNSQSSWTKRIEEYTAQYFLDPVNGVCNDYSVTFEEFKSGIFLESVTVYPIGKFIFVYEDSILSGGHGIYVECDLQSGPYDVHIEG